VNTMTRALWPDSRTRVLSAAFPDESKYVEILGSKMHYIDQGQDDVFLFAQFIAVCRRLNWSKHVTNSPCLALLAMAGSNAACKMSSACSNAFR
jgi:hypothetical protein